MEELKAKRQPNPPQRCVFCGGGNISKEHIFAEWMKGMLPYHDGTKHTVVTYDPMTGQPTMRPGKMDLKGDHRARGLRVVCKVCNETWMSGIQTAAKPPLTPLVAGPWQPIAPAAAPTLSAWACLLAMVLEHAEPSLVSCTQHERDVMKASKTAPPWWRIWAGPFDAQRGNLATWHRVWHLELQHDWTADLATGRAHATVFAAGALMVVIFSTDLPLTDDGFWRLEQGLISMGMQQVHPTLQGGGAAVPFNFDSFFHAMREVERFTATIGSHELAWE